MVAPFLPKVEKEHQLGIIWTLSEDTGALRGKAYEGVKKLVESENWQRVKYYYTAAIPNDPFRKYAKVGAKGYVTLSAWRLGKEKRTWKNSN